MVRFPSALCSLPVASDRTLLPSRFRVDPRKMPRPHGWEPGPKDPEWFESYPDPPPFTQGLGWWSSLGFGPGPDQRHLKGAAGVSRKRRVRHVRRACDRIVSGMRTHSSRN
eukprot:1102257-Pyramimonas_sp.AAC.1